MIKSRSWQRKSKSEYITGPQDEERRKIVGERFMFGSGFLDRVYMVPKRNN